MLKLNLDEWKMWKVIDVKLDHNHETTPSSARFYQSHKNISTLTRRKIELNCDAGIQVNKTFQSLAVQVGRHENLTYDEQDVRNYIAKCKRLKLIEGDTHTLHKYFCSMQMKNPNFFYLFDFHDDLHLNNIF